MDNEGLLREWLRNERRLGIPVAPVAPRRPASPRGPAAASETQGPSVAPTPAARPARANAPVAEPRGLAVSGPRRTAAAAPALIPAAASFIPDDPNLPPLNTQDLSPAAAAEALAQLERDFVRACRKCRLCEQRTQTVFGVGSPRPQLAFVGEGPGADEDAQGIPFVGRAGQLLTRMIAAMTLTRDQVYIGNVVKCRPPGNRTPADDEMATCAPFLFRQLAILRPKVIVTLGRPAAQTLLATKTPITKLRGTFQDFPPPELAHYNLPATKLMPTFHPAYLLRNPEAKGDVWEDLKQVMRFLGLKLPEKN